MSGKSTKPYVWGSMWLTGAKIWFVCSAYLIYAGLSRLLTPEEFGTYGLVISTVSILNMVIIKGTIQSVSKFVTKGDPEQVKRQALRIMLVAGGTLGLLFVLFAGLFSELLRDRSLTPYFQMAALIILFYALYAVMIGYLNGTQQFLRQGLFDCFYSFLRLVLILGMAWIFRSVFGAVLGFVLAAGLIVAAAVFIIGSGNKGAAFHAKEFLGFSGFLVMFHLLANILMNVDLFLLKALTASAENGAASVGFYNASLTIARVPFMLLSALNLVVFPLIATSVAHGDESETKKRVIKGCATCLLVTLLPSLLISADAAGTMRLIYPAEYLEGAGALTLLGLAYGFYTLFMFSCTIINGCGKPLAAVLFAAGAIALQAVLCALLIPVIGLKGAALGSLGAFGLGLCAAIGFLCKKGMLEFDYRFLFKVGVVSGIVFLLSFSFQNHGMFFILKNIALILVFAFLLILFRVVDMRQMASLLSRKS